MSEGFRCGLRHGVHRSFLVTPSRAKWQAMLEHFFSKPEWGFDELDRIDWSSPNKETRQSTRILNMRISCRRNRTFTARFHCYELRTKARRLTASLLLGTNKHMSTIEEHNESSSWATSNRVTSVMRVKKSLIAKSMPLWTGSLEGSPSLQRP